MDAESVKYSKDRFTEIKTEISIFLKKVGYKPDNVLFVPISGWTGDNMVEKSDKMPWYDGPTLTKAIDAQEPPKRPT